MASTSAGNVRTRTLRLRALCILPHMTCNVVDVLQSQPGERAAVMGKKLKTLTYVWFVAIFTCLAIPAAAQTEDKQDKAAAPRQSSDTVQRDPSADKQAEPDKQPTLDVKPGSPAIKTSAEREPLSPLKHLPSHILKDQKAIWTSPFHTSRQDAKWWAIFGVTTAAF